MSLISRQAVTGAFVGAALVLGANASPNGAPPDGALTIGAQLALPHQGALAEVLRTCRDRILDDALDAAGEIAARLKQM